MRKILILFLFLSGWTNLQVYSQIPCANAEANSTAGDLEKHVYKTYLDKKGNEKELHIGLARPVDKLPAKKRPLIIGVHGGGFMDFCPFEPCYARFSENVLTRHFTPQGFLTASVQYRLTSPFDFKPPRIKDETLRETHYKATQDARDAIKFIFENAEKFGVDTKNVFLVGTSAGAITALHAAYLDGAEVPEDLSKKYGALAKREKISGVISLSGAVYDLSYLKNEQTPLMLVHGNEDFIVPPDKGFYFGLKHLTPVFG
ncbi:MAG TPA: alpha/beta hydrolase, partial [Pyrinomonadaceae bacterium]|nr:alpha/beta hydrolase [Pyrinomonadaceae bacterium]